MNLRRALLPLALACLYFGAAHAQFFLGTVGSTLITPAAVVPFVGLQAGSYDLGGGFGARGSVELFPLIFDGTTLLQAEAAGLYVIGEGVKLYTGPSLGLFNAGGDTVPFGGVTLGVDFDAESVISIYLEVQPRYYFGGTPSVLIRSGTNFHLGL